jgi:hypothetical protein
MNENPTDRPRDVIDLVEKIAGIGGNFNPVDEGHYQGFIDLTCPELERLVVLMMLSQEKEVRRLAHKRSKAGAVRAVSKFIINGIRVISMGLMAVDAFGRVGMFARIGLDPNERMQEALDKRFQEIEPIVEDEVSRTLPWLLSRDGGQGQLAL